HLIWKSAEGGDFATAEAVRNSVEELAFHYPNDPRLREALAMGLWGLIAGGANRNVEGAQDLYENLVTLAKENAAHSVVQEIQAGAGANLIIAFVQLHDLTAAQRVYDTIAKLVANDGNEGKLRESLAVSTAALIGGYSLVDDDTTATRLYESMRKMSTEHPDEAKLVNLQAQAAANLLASAARRFGVVGARSLYDSLMQACVGHPAESEMREQLSRMLVRLIYEYINIKNWTMARALFGLWSGVSTPSTEFKPDYAGAHNGLGGLLADRGQLEEAIAEYRAATDLRPEFWEAHY